MYSVDPQVNVGREFRQRDRFPPSSHLFHGGEKDPGILPKMAETFRLRIYSRLPRRMFKRYFFGKAHFLEMFTKHVEIDTEDCHRLL